MLFPRAPAWFLGFMVAVPAWQVAAQQPAPPQPVLERPAPLGTPHAEAARAPGAGATRTPTGAEHDAVVLSGGGSRGLAHVGVLLYLGEHGIDPDIVVGNSMGAVVGALYAAGYDAVEIRRRVESVGWNGMFRSMPTLTGPGQIVRLPMLSFDMNVPERRVNRGVFGEWHINRALAKLFFDANARAHGDFDRLPRRYRALAADLETGEPVVIEGGDLARAVRASMAYPGLFAPVKWNDLVLVDGGIVDNLPTLEARALGATRLIAVDVTRPNGNDVSRSPLAVVQRSLNLMQIRMHRDTIPPDVRLDIDIAANGFAAASFPDDPAEYIDAGYAAATAGMSDLSPSPTRGDRSASMPPASIGMVVIESPDPALGAMVASAFSSLAGAPYDADAVLLAIDRAYTAGLVHGVWPRIEVGPDTTQPATLYVLVDATSPTTLSMAGGYDNDRGGRAWASLGSHTRLGLRPLTRTVAFSFTPIERWAAVSALIHSTARPGPALSIGANIQERVLRSFGDDVIRTASVWRGGGWMGIELPTGLRSGFVTMALRGEWIDAEEADGYIGIGPVVRFAQVPPELSFVGEPMLLEGEVRWGSNSWSRFAARGSYAFDAPRFVPGVRLAVLADVRAVSPNAPPDDWPALGDEHAVPGLRWGELRDRARMVLGADVGRRVGAGAIRMRLRTGTVSSDLFEIGSTDWIAGSEFGLAWPIPLGALGVGWGVSTRGDSRLTVDIGRYF